MMFFHSSIAYFQCDYDKNDCNAIVRGYFWRRSGSTPSYDTGPSYDNTRGFYFQNTPKFQNITNTIITKTK